MLTITPKELKDAVARVKQATDPKSAVPVFGAIRFYVSGNGAHAWLEASTNEQACRRNVTNDSMHLGELDVLVHTKYVDKVLKVFAKANAIEVRASDDGAVFSAGSRKVETPTEMRAEWEDPKFESGPRLLAGEAKPLHDRLTRALAFASTDFTRPHLTAVALDLHPKEPAVFVATDSYRLCVLPTGASETLTPAEPETHALMSHTFANVIKGMKSAFTYELYMPNATTSPWYVHVLDEGAEIWQTRQSEGRYPNWRQLIPDEGTFGVDLVLPKPALVSAAEAAKVIAERNAPMRLVVNGDVHATVVQPDGPQFEETIEGASVVYLNDQARSDHAGRGVEYGYNPDFLVDCAKHLGGADSEIRAKLMTPLRPVLMEADGDRALLMPIRLNV